MNITGRMTMDKTRVELCEHIAIEILEMDDESEYSEDIEIECLLCEIIHEITILVN